MAKYNFKGDVDDLSERQLDFINSIIQEYGLTDSKVFIEPVGKAGDNYVANVKRITVDGPNKTMKMIAKVAPTLEFVRQTMNTYLLFRNEHVMYTEVLPKLVQLQKNAGVPEDENLRYAKCYGSLTEQPNEIILLEDLNVSNFIMLDRFSSLSNDCVKSVLRNFAVLHSLAYVLKHKEPETYEKFKTSLIDMWSLLAENEEIKIYFQALENDMITILEEPKHIELLRNKITNISKLAVKFAKIEANNKYSVIQQGDAWTNNILFRFEEDTLKESIMIDYQISKNSSPVNDLLYMIFNCTDHETRKKHFYDWIDYYHSELEKSLYNFDLKVNFWYPRDKLDADLKQYAKLQFGFSMMLASALIRKSDDAAKMKDAMTTKFDTSSNAMDQMQLFLISSLDNDTITLFRNRVVGLIESFTELGLL